MVQGKVYCRSARLLIRAVVQTCLFKSERRTWADTDGQILNDPIRGG